MNITIGLSKTISKSFEINILVNTESFDLLVARIDNFTLISTYDADVEYPNTIVFNWTVESIINALKEDMSQFNNEYRETERRFLESDYEKIAEQIYRLMEEKP